METWPNWVDLIVIILILKGCYSGFAGGFLAAVLTLIGAVVAAALAVNYWVLLLRLLARWIPAAQTVLVSSLVFWLFFLFMVAIVQYAVKQITRFVKWERVFWPLQVIGIVLGGLRGLWWSAFLIVVLTSSGVTYLKESAEARSMFGLRFAKQSREYFETVVNRFPGATARGAALVPPFRRSTRPKPAADT